MCSVFSLYIGSAKIGENVTEKSLKIADLRCLSFGAVLGLSYGTMQGVCKTGLSCHARIATSNHENLTFLAHTVVAVCPGICPNDRCPTQI